MYLYKENDGHQHEWEQEEYHYSIHCSGDTCDRPRGIHRCGNYIRKYEYCIHCGKQREIELIKPY